MAAVEDPQAMTSSTGMGIYLDQYAFLHLHGFVNIHTLHLRARRHILAASSFSISPSQRDTHSNLLVSFLRPRFTTLISTTLVRSAVIC